MGRFPEAAGRSKFTTVTATGHFQKLVGHCAPREFEQLLVYKAMTFSPSIQLIENCVAYHSGSVRLTPEPKLNSITN